MNNNKTKECYPSDSCEIKPCPFCGNLSPFGYHNPFIAYLGCNNCEIYFGSVKVIYKKDELPQELKEYTYEPKMLSIEKDGKTIDYPEHNMVGVNAIAAFNNAGILEKWNNRK